MVWHGIVGGVGGWMDGRLVGCFVIGLIDPAKIQSINSGTDSCVSSRVDAPGDGVLGLRE
jgi:hypothetical protein